MKQLLLFRRYFVSFLFLAVSTLSWAYDFEANGIYYNKNSDGTTVTVTYKTTNRNNYSGSVVIPSTVTYDGKTYSVTSIGYDAFYGCTGLTSVTIPNSVTSIRTGAFNYCSNLTSITIPNSVTSIGPYAFARTAWYNNQPNGMVYAGKVAYKYKGTMPSGTQIVIKEGTSEIAGKAFDGYSGLTSITIPNSVTSIGSNAFYGCTGLSSVTCHAQNVPTTGSSVFAQVPQSTLYVPAESVDAYKSASQWKDFGTIRAIGEVEDFSVDGIYYHTNPGVNTAYVTYKDTDYNSYSGAVVIPSTVAYGEKTYDVTGIGSSAFSGCSGLASITIPNSVTSIGSSAFSGCSGLTSVTLNSNSIVSKTYTSSSNIGTIFGSQVKEYVLGDNITTIGSYAFSGCSGLTSVTIPNSVTSIGDDAFWDCTGLTKAEFASIESLCKIYFNNYESNPLYYAKHLYINGKEVTDVVIPNSITSINEYTFRNCSGLTSVTIPESVTSIGSSAFRGCTGLTSITIPNSVTSIGSYAFYNCTSLTKVTLNSNDVVSKTYTSSSNLSTIFGSQVKEYILGDNITAIGNYAFYGCSGLTSVICHAQKVPSAGSYVFYNVPSTATLYVPAESVNAYKSTSPWRNFGEIRAIGEVADFSVDGIYYHTNPGVNTAYVTYKDTDYNSYSGAVVIPSTVAYGYKTYDVTGIGSYAFRNCSGLTSVTIPNSVTNIGGYAFSGCSSLTSVTLPDKLSYIGSDAFPSNTKIYVNKGVPAIFAAWRYGIAPYEVSTNTSLASPTLSVSSTQATVTASVSPVHSGLTYEIDGKYNITSKSSSVKYTGLRPGESRTVELVVSAGGDSYTVSKSVTTKALNPSVSLAGSSASSVRVQGGRTAGDAEIISESFTVNGVTKTGHTANFTGLTPNQKYSVEYKALVKYGTSGEKTYLYTAEGEVSTSALTLTTSQPKVISAGNVIVEAVSNLDDEEENVGFEWRRTDWSDDFKSNTGVAYLYEGTMEGYIRNLYTEKLWKVRPYYKSNSGNLYYGDWVGIDPTNTSYFEPTVHTYAKINIDGNRAQLSGYVQRGSDEVRRQGFMYWISESGARVAADAGLDSRALAASAVPSSAKTIEAEGRVMEVELTGLKPNTTYVYVAFVTTTEGETFYGKQLSFTTGDDPEASVTGDANGNGEVEIGDVTSVLTLMATPEATGYNNKAADANGNGVIEIGDVTTILTIMAGN